MARNGKMLFSDFKVGVGNEILARSEFEAVPMTLDFSADAGYLEDADGDVYIPAGTPIDKSGTPVTANPWTNVVGILLSDVYESRPQGTVLVKAYINTEKAMENSEVTYDADLVALLLGNITFETPLVSPQSNLVGIGLVGSMVI